MPPNREAVTNCLPVSFRKIAMPARSAISVLLAITACFTLTGCGPGPITGLRTHVGCPWCAPNRQVREGQRSTGKSFYGDIWKSCWMADNGQEYDPEQVAQQVWNYLKTTGDAAKIETARIQGACTHWMRIVSVNPVIVIRIPCQHPRFAGTSSLQSHGTKLPLELSFVPKEEMFFDEPMEWLSPDLKKGPIKLSFSDQGIAEIPLPSGKLRLSRNADRCQITRE